MDACQLLNVVSRSVSSRQINAQVRVRLEAGNAVVLAAVASLGDERREVSSRFVFDGDMVLLRGFGKAADQLEMRINQFRHEGWEVA